MTGGQKMALAAVVLGALAFALRNVEQPGETANGEKERDSDDQASKLADPDA